MPLTFDRCASHRWFDNTQRWLALYRERGLSLDRIAFDNDLAPGLSGMKTAMLYYAAQRAMYLAQSELLMAAFRAETADWEEPVGALAARAVGEYLCDVQELLTGLGVELGPLSAPEVYLADPPERDWADVLHALEERNLARPRSEESLAAWLRACLGAKLAEEAQSLRRAALGHWLARRYGIDTLAAVVDANLDAFAWRILGRLGNRFAAEQVDPRSGRAIRWPGLRTDTEVEENGALTEFRRGSGHRRNTSPDLRTLYAAVVRGRPVAGSRQVAACPRGDAMARTGALAEEAWGWADVGGVRRVFCKFCFMHAYAEIVRGAPAYLTVERIESATHLSVGGGCGLQWTFGCSAASLLGRRRDAARLAYAARIGEAPPALVYVDELPPDRPAVDLARSVWDRTRLG